jgi:hypothetical protein
MQDTPSGRGGTGGTSGTYRVGLRDREAEKCEELERPRECPGRDATRNSFGDSTSISCFCDMCWRKATGRRTLRAPSSQHLVTICGMREWLTGFCTWGTRTSPRRSCCAPPSRAGCTRPGHRTPWGSIRTYTVCLRYFRLRVSIT